MLVVRLTGHCPVRVLGGQQCLGHAEPGCDEIAHEPRRLRELQLTIRLRQLLQLAARHERNRFGAVEHSAEQRFPLRSECSFFGLAHPFDICHDVVRRAVSTHQPGIEFRNVLRRIRVERPCLKLRRSAVRIRWVETSHPRHFIRREPPGVRTVSIRKTGHEIDGIRNRRDVIRHHAPQFGGRLAIARPVQKRFA